MEALLTALRFDCRFIVTTRSYGLQKELGGCLSMLVRFEATLRIIQVVAVLIAIALYTFAYTLSSSDSLRTNSLWLARFFVFPLASIALLLYGALRVFSRLRCMSSWNVIAVHVRAKPTVQVQRQA